jgi:hypothetical protein
LNRKVSRLESINAHKERLEYHQHGEGLYIFRNNTKGTLELPKPTATGVKHVPAPDPARGITGEWQGDNYYMGLVRKNMARLVREIISPTQEKEIKMKQAQEKLLLDQPDQVTTEGKVEHVVDPTSPALPNAKKPKKVNESKPAADKLLVEDPSEGVRIIH